MSYNLEVCAQCQSTRAHGKYYGVETARTCPGAQALGAWLTLIMSFYAPDSPEKGLHFTEEDPTLSGSGTPAQGHTNSEW